MTLQHTATLCNKAATRSNLLQQAATSGAFYEFVKFMTLPHSATLCHTLLLIATQSNRLELFMSS